MGRGIVSGLVWGVIVSVVVLAGVSLNTPLPERIAPADAPLAPAQDQAAASPSEPPADSPPQSLDPASAPPALPDAGEPGQEVVADPASAPAAQPVGADADMPPPALDPLPEPEAAAEPLAATPPADTVASPPGQPAVQPIAPADIAPLIEIAPQDAVAPSTPTPLMAQDRDASPDALDTAAPAAPIAPIAPMPTPPPLATAAPEGLPAPADAPVLPQVAPPMAASPDPMTPPSQPEMPPAARRTDAPQPPAATPPADTPPAGALARNAVDFAADPDRPVMSIILIDDADGPLTPEVLAQIDFPISFAIDPRSPDAAARAALLQEAGFEVLIYAAAAIPAGASAADVEVSLAAAEQSLPQAVAMLDSPESRIQADRPVLEAVIGVLTETGHGLVAFPRNLNAAEQSARRDGVPAATAFRLLDDEDQRAPVISRYLDRAAFAAGQEGAVIVVGQSRPDTVTAVFSWALGGRGEAVALAPVSAVLTRLAE